MGIHSLWRLLDYFGEPTNPEEWRGKTIAIDSSFWISQFRSNGSNKSSTNSEIGDKDEKTLNLERLVERILKLIYYDITPVFVFDGASPAIKILEIENRRRLREINEENNISNFAIQILRNQISADHSLKTSGAALKKIISHMECNRKRLRKSFSGECNRKAKFVLSKQFNVERLVRDSNDEIVEERIHMENSPVEVASLSCMGSFLETEAERHNLRQESDFIRKDNRLANNNSDTISSLFFGSRAALYRDTSDASNSSTDDVVEVKRNPPIHFQAGIPTASPLVSYPNPVSSHLIAQRSLTAYTTPAIQNITSNDIIDVDLEVDLVSVKLTSSSDAIILSQETESKSTEIFVIHDDETNKQISMMPVDPDMNKGVETDTAVKVHVNTSPIPKIFDFCSHGAAGSNKQVPSHLLFELGEVFQILDLFRVPYIIAPFEADAQLSYLSYSGLVDAVFSEDSDIVAHGAEVTLRGFFSRSSQKNSGMSSSMVAYRRTKLQAVGLCPAVLKTMALLVGCDYTEGIERVGVKGALQIIGAFWPQSAPLHYLDSISTSQQADIAHYVLSQWASAVRMGGNRQKEEKYDSEIYSILQDLILQRKTVLKCEQSENIPHNFPRLDVIEAWFNPPLKEVTGQLGTNGRLRTLKSKGPVDWESLMAFARRCGIPTDNLCRVQQYISKRAMTNIQEATGKYPTFFDRVQISQKKQDVSRLKFTAEAIPEGSFSKEIRMVAAALLP